jgi:hypothetical protein
VAMKDYERSGDFLGVEKQDLEELKGIIACI